MSIGRANLVEPLRHLIATIVAGSKTETLELSAKMLAATFRLHNRYPAVCNAVDRWPNFSDCPYVIVKRTGPPQGSSVAWMLRKKA